MIDFSSKSDEQLVSFCKRGYRKAFDELIFRHGKYLKNWIYKLCRNDEGLADEIFSLTLVRSWQKINTFKGKSSLRTWMSTVSRNCFYDEMRRVARRNFVDSEKVPFLSSRSTNPKNEEREGVIHEGISLDFTLREESLPSKRIESAEAASRNSHLVRKIFSRLKEREREILFLRDIEELGYAAIAKRLQIPIGTVMSRLYYSRKKAFKILKLFLK